MSVLVAVTCMWEEQDEFGQGFRQWSLGPIVSGPGCGAAHHHGGK